MNIYRPRKPTGTSRKMLFFTAVWEFLWGGKFPFIDTDTVKWDRGGSGYAANVKAARGGAGGSSVAMYRLKSVQGDYITVRTWDNTIEGDVDILVARPPEIRKPASESVDGVLVSYTYVSDIQRTASKTVDSVTTTETQIINPRLNGNDLIFPVQVKNTGVFVSGVELDKIFFSNRAWTKKSSA